MCSQCEKLNCQKCIDKWFVKGKDCPNCRAPYVAAKLNRFTLNALQAYDINCNRCTKQFKYEKTKQHFDTNCQPIVFNKCPKKKCYEENIEGLNKLREHLSKDCERIKL